MTAANVGVCCDPAMDVNDGAADDAAPSTPTIEDAGTAVGLTKAIDPLSLKSDGPRTCIGRVTCEDYRVAWRRTLGELEESY
jgi:hypothetical protein